MGDQDWDTVVLRKKQPKSGKLKSQQALSAAQRAGLEIDTQKKFGAASNKHTGTSMNTAKLDRETEELKHNTVGLDVGKLIQQGRQAKNMTQKDLATKINEKPQVVNDYEAGRAIPNQTIIGKLERVLEMRLRGAHKGEVLISKVKK